MPLFAVLNNEGTQAILDLRDASPRVLSLGAPVPGDPQALAAAQTISVAEAGADVLAPITLLPQASLGFLGRPGIEGARADGSGSAPRFGAAELEVDGHRVVATSVAVGAGLSQRVEVELLAGGVLRVRAEITNVGADDYSLHSAQLSVEMPSWAREVMRLGGRWSNEFRPERVAWDDGAVLVENRSGRTSHDRYPAMFLGRVGFGETHGFVWGAHLGWSGNAALRAEVLSDGRRVLQAGELLLPGEIVLAPNESYLSPWLYLAASDHGLNGVSDRFHAMLRARPSHPSSPRPVLLNTWEAVYFNHDLATLKALADRAAAVGAERFVLDDGWFRHRRNDKAGLGDWFVDEDVWPDGLDPLIDHVTGLGLEFGLWFEPEMLNPDSDLYREHPEWALVDASYTPVLARNQLVLDLANPDAYAFIRDRIVSILDEYDIGYVKWDMNRNLVGPVHGRRASVHHQTRAVYRLIDDIRAAHPAVEIESCSSGGGRADFAILERTDRVWTSDCNDALDRQRIQRGCSYLLPPELMGAHIGPPRAHTTGRTHQLSFRAATAFFGHLGIEWNLLELSEDELGAVANVVALHKKLRPLLHGGRTMRFDAPDPACVANGVIAADRSHAVIVVAQVATSNALSMGAIPIVGLDPERRYVVTVVDLAERRGGKAKAQAPWAVDGIELTGAQLAAGLQPPILDPEDAILVELRATD